ncbi:hypothetical protein IKG10_02200 [Candidatus Saccharibacteria bacterium]|nr:hypothetical protein [Candidatus Saccharibacteria bacterium]
MKRNRFVYIVGIVGLAVLFTMLNVTSPTEIGPVGVLLFFTTLYVVFFCVFAILMRLFRRVALGKNDFGGKNYLYAAVLAFGPIMLLMARSFGAINLWTIFLIVLFLTLAEFLVYKRV